jgi:hypothetical protein
MPCGFSWRLRTFAASSRALTELLGRPASQPRMLLRDVIDQRLSALKGRAPAFSEGDLCVGDAGLAMAAADYFPSRPSGALQRETK